MLLFFIRLKALPSRYVSKKPCSTKRVHQVPLLLPLSSISDSWLRLSVLGSLPAPYLVDSVPASSFLVVYHTSMSCRKKDEHPVLYSTVLLRIRVGRLASKGSLLARQWHLLLYPTLASTWHLFKSALCLLFVVW